MPYRKPNVRYFVPQVTQARLQAKMARGCYDVRQGRKYEEEQEEHILGRSFQKMQNIEPGEQLSSKVKRPVSLYQIHTN